MPITRAHPTSPSTAFENGRNAQLDGRSKVGAGEKAKGAKSNAEIAQEDEVVEADDH